MAKVTPYQIRIPDADLDDLAERLCRTRWPEQETVADWPSCDRLHRGRSPTAPPGNTTSANCRSWKARCCVSPWTGCPASATPNRCGCGARPPTPARRTWTAGGKRSYAASISKHTFRLFKQTLGWTAPVTISGDATRPRPTRWTWLILAAYTQLRLARHLTVDLRRPWERPATRPDRLTQPVSASGFHRIRPKTADQPTHRNPADLAPAAPPDSPTNDAQSTRQSGKVKDAATAARPERQTS
ncbi:hypothetical protein BL253_37905 [Pseudofrankia asymbiotica]|uniref:Uncharacterized protein n=1 Tax=Pseudofrankia asymbiotica TaxID=1834516 RepID=A0A1V2HZ55_9ACTN|nr:hypothetical protein [Pseudofrankia asymbiotica]ONH21782.1 hypothetical protein BL253_37905 [Pseudofrankia asymbiotica]